MDWWTAWDSKSWIPMIIRKIFILRRAISAITARAVGFGTCTAREGDEIHVDVWRYPIDLLADDAIDTHGGARSARKLVLIENPFAGADAVPPAGI